MKPRFGGVGVMDEEQLAEEEELALMELWEAVVVWEV